MTSTNATKFRQNLFEYLSLAVDYNDVISVSTKSGNAVVMSEEDYNGLLETMYLLSHPAVREEILEGAQTDLADCVPEDEVSW